MKKSGIKGLLQEAKKFICKYPIPILLSVLAISIIYVIVWIWFSVDGPIKTDGIDKSQWLSFFGSFLSFIGTTLLGIVTVRLSKNAYDMNKKSIEELHTPNVTIAYVRLHNDSFYNDTICSSTFNYNCYKLLENSPYYTNDKNQEVSHKEFEDAKYCLEVNLINVGKTSILDLNINTIKYKNSKDLYFLELKRKTLNLLSLESESIYFLATKKFIDEFSDQTIKSFAINFEMRNEYKLYDKDLVFGSKGVIKNSYYEDISHFDHPVFIENFD